jgi:alkylphenol/PAH-inducible cytochrome P450 monooxygenase
MRRYDLIFRVLWYYIPELLMEFIQNLPTPRFQRFRKYSTFIRKFSRGIIEKSMIEGDGKDIMSVLLRANASEDLKGKLSDIEMVDQVA